jgi:hypothetical protein
LHVIANALVAFWGISSSALMGTPQKVYHITNVMGQAISYQMGENPT